MKQIKYNVITEGEDDYTIRTGDGGLAVIRHNGENLLTDYYQDRTKDAEIDWDKMSESKMYCKDWEDKTFIDQDMIYDALHWLVHGIVYFTLQKELLFKPNAINHSTTAEKNEVLAEFIGMTKTNIGWCDENGSLPSHFYGGNIHESLYFRESYDWLIPVIEVIEDLGFIYGRRNGQVSIKDKELIIINEESSEDGLSMLQKTYNMVVSFVNYYNNLKES